MVYSPTCNIIKSIAYLGDESTTEAIIKKCDVNVTLIGWPLVLAAERGYEEIAKFLIDNNADVNARDVLDIPAARYGKLLK